MTVNSITPVYIVVKIGVEGIDDLGKAFHEEEDAIEYINKKRDVYRNAPPLEDYNEEEDIDHELSYYYYLLRSKKEWGDGNTMAENYIEREIRSFCIQMDDGSGFKCVCRELEVNVDDEMWLY